MNTEKKTDIKILSEAVNESLKHVSKDMLDLKTIVDNLKSEIIKLKNNHTVKVESLSKDFSNIRVSITETKSKIETVAKSVKQIRGKEYLPEKTKRKKEDMSDVISEINDILSRINKIENKLKM
jgi:radical SAM superfamily enzyme